MAKYKIIPSSRNIVQSPISIGHKAEKGVEAIEFDVTAWVETYGSGTLTVIMRRWGDAIPYPIALEIDENNKATWVLSDTDTARAGMAYAQLSYIVGETVVKKSDIYTFRVMDSLTGEGEPPEAYESWLEHLTHLAAEAMAEVLDIEGIVTDKTLTVDGGIADAKATGEALAEKVDAADYSELSARVGANTIALAEKADRSTTYTKTEVDQMISDVEVETDTTLEIAGAPADAAETGRQIGLIKADLGAQTGLFHWNERGLIDLSGSSVNLTPETNQGIDYAVIDCSAGDKFIITATGGNKSRVWGFIDGNNAILTVSDANATVENFEITAPTNAVKLILNAYRNSNIYAYKVGNNLATKASNGLSDEVKEAILNCFRNVGWLDETDGKESFNALLEAFGMSDFYNTWEWSYPGSLNMYKGTPQFLEGSSTDGVLLANSQIYAKNKRTVFVGKGKLKVVEAESVSGDLFPIPIPSGATLVRASINPSNMQVLLQRWRLQGDVYKLDGISAWQTGTATLSFSSAHDTFICVNIRYDSSQSVFPTEPQGLEITFE